jgi:hypothetical protein
MDRRAETENALHRLVSIRSLSECFLAEIANGEILRSLDSAFSSRFHNRRHPRALVELTGGDEMRLVMSAVQADEPVRPASFGEKFGTGLIAGKPTLPFEKTDFWCLHGDDFSRQTKSESLVNYLPYINRFALCVKGEEGGQIVISIHEVDVDVIDVAKQSGEKYSSQTEEEVAQQFGEHVKIFLEHMLDELDPDIMTQRPQPIISIEDCKVWFIEPPPISKEAQ